ncbi:ABC transporter ATP-binding protein [Paenibacillus lutrae]|uniref:ATP-binding cassette domain-containing protein n=1 Tax=Paenibacillus lutrae TaxID=2078573 RepID=A0A7X3FL80_9BACL|nr:ABC transporter ATP-binding protein [Paenibacillus lutrae]MVP01768.1 ATP-binding cassette domain-containing protein [Paenibacillus lutrae]
MLSVNSISKRIDGEPVLRNISFDLGPGRIAALIGRNGAGKTTLLRTLIGILDPDQGEITWKGLSVQAFPQTRQEIVYVPDSLSMLNSYTALECAKLYRLSYPGFDEVHFSTQLRRFNLPEGKKIRSFSKGMKALVGILLAFSARANLILLDEPTNGLDPIIRKQILSYMMEEVSESGVSLLISSHQLHELERISDTVIMIREGQLASISSLDGAKQTLHKLQIVFNGEAPADLLNLPHIRVVQHIVRVYTLLLQDDTQEILHLLEEQKPLLLEQISIELDDVFDYHLRGDDEYVS